MRQGPAAHSGRASCRECRRLRVLLAAALLRHRGHEVARAGQQLVELFAGLLSDVAAEGRLRDDVAPSELAAYCLSALAAANSVPTEEAVHRLVGVTVDGLRPRP